MAAKTRTTPEDNPLNLRPIRAPAKGEEEREFCSAMQAMVVLASTPGGEDGKAATRTLCYWIQKLGDLSAEQMEDLRPIEMMGYEARLQARLTEALEIPGKKS